MKVGLVVLMDQGSSPILTVDEESAKKCIQDWSEIRANGRFMQPVFVSPDYTFSVLYEKIVGMYIIPDSNLREKSIKAQIELAEAVQKSISEGESWKDD